MMGSILASPNGPKPAEAADLRVRQSVESKPGWIAMNIHTNFGVWLEVGQLERKDHRSGPVVTMFSSCCGWASKLDTRRNVRMCSSCGAALLHDFAGDIDTPHDLERLRLALTGSATEAVGPLLATLAVAGLMVFLDTYTLGIRPEEWTFHKEHALYPG